MNKKEILIIGLIICILLSVSAVSAADSVQDNIDDAKLSVSDMDSVQVSNDLSSYSHSKDNQILRGENDDAGSFSDLQDAIDSETGDTITLDKNYTFNASSVDDRALEDSGIVVSKSGTFTIIGNPDKNITINGLEESKLFSFAGNVVVRNVNFVNGLAYKNSPITSTGTLDISNAIFSNNIGKQGGAIQANGGLTVTYSIFEGNLAQDGGSIYISNSGETSLIENCNFTNSRASMRDGGAIYSNSPDLTLRHINITKSTAPERGGAIMINGPNTVLDDVYVERCKATNGGAIYEAYATKQASYLTLIKNQAFENGGGIYLLADCAGNDIASGITNSTFKDNFATEDGGAIIINGSNWRVYNSTFTSNKVNNRYGGAIYIENGDDNQIVLCNFTTNTASSSGGAVYLYNSTRNTIAHSNFTHNSAVISGGAVNWNYGSDNGTLTYCIFDSNTANAGDGGGVYWNSTRANITHSTFNYNKARQGEDDTGLGGGIALSGSYSNITNCTFEHNSAAVSAGGVAIKNDIGECVHCTVRDSTFKLNDATRYGGALYWGVNCLYGDVINCTFDNNTAQGSAGAVEWQGDYANIYNSTFRFNEAEGRSDYYHGDGGALTFTGNHNYAYNCTFTNNTAKEYGGAVYMQLSTVSGSVSDDTTLELCKFTNNTAQSNGGAVAWAEGSTNGDVTRCIFVNNTAWRSGGAVYWYGTHGDIEYSNFTNNKALGCVTDANGGGDGGAILWVGSHGYVNHCNFTSNFAEYRGGATFLKGSTNTTFNDTRFRFNIAGTNGGAIDWQEGSHDGRLLNSIFINNTAWRSAGAIYWNGFNGTIYNCNFTNNTAVGNATEDNRTYAHIVYTTEGGNGGALVWVGSLGTSTYVNFINNTASRLGGAVFLEQNDNVTIRYANFTKNYAGINGGAIDWYKGAANGRLEHVNFLNNTAERSGGAIYWYGHNGTLYDVTFKFNRALGNASYINPFGENTTGGDGGAIIWTGYDGNVTVSKFINNTAAKRGGAVFLQGTTEYVCNNTRFKTALFENNTAGTNGGAVDWFKGATHGSIDNATFKNNIANRSGGAIYWNGDWGDILNSNFTNNRAKGETWAINAYGENTTGGSGGAIIWSGSYGNVYNCRFIDNNASKHGGAVYMQGTSEENCTNTTFELCYFEGNNATVNGGALDWHEGAQDGVIKYSNFTQNRARSNGGAIFWNGHGGEISHSNFTYNYALGIEPDDNGNHGDGGAIIWSGRDGLVDGCWFKFNDAAARGGAVYLQACGHGNNNTNFTNSHFINNTAGTNGGALDWHYGAEHGIVNHTEFINNTAGREGGAIYWNGDHGSIIDSNFTNNFAVQTGGAIHWEGHNGLINGSIFKDNKITGLWNQSTPTVYYLNPNTGINEEHYNITGGDGGAILWKGSEGTIENTTFYKNYAPYRGGAIFFTSLNGENCSNITIKKGNFTLNDAGMNGGALDWAKGAHNATILRSYFHNNTAGRSAGALYVSGDDLDIEHTEFKYNEVTGETKYDNRTNVSNYTSIGGNGGAICWMGSYGDVYNVTFLNNTATQRGGAIQFERNVNGTIKESRFINNSAGTEGGAIDFYNNAVNGKIINSNFTNNTAKVNGGAIYWQGYYGLINGSRFENNRATGLVGNASYSRTVLNTRITPNREEIRYDITGGDGGAIKWTGSHSIIENCTFYKNNASYLGGAIYFIGNSTDNCTNISIIDTTFEENIAYLNGGALNWAKGSSNSSIVGSHFINNTAKRTAGAIYVSGNYIQINDTEFKFNKATCEVTYDNRNSTNGTFSSLGGNGGAICWMGSNGAIDNGTFINNTAAERGGAIQFEENKYGVVKNSNFENNTAIGDGGAIDWYKGADYGQIINTTFKTNRVDADNSRGSGVYIEGYNATIKDSRFYKHDSITDGGVVYIEGNEASVKNTTFENIHTTKCGGAIFVDGNNTLIKDSNFTDVHADMNGGAIYIEGQNTTISGSKFNLTYSLNKGGAIYVDGRNASIIWSDFINSTSDNDGGALYVIGVECKLYNSTFENNTAMDDGGAIYWDGNYGEIYNITCINNNAVGYTDHHSKGGTICLTANYTSIDKSNITGSFASYNGGAMFITGNNATITDSDFKNCHVNITLTPEGDDLPYGGALYILGDNTTAKDCTFDNCTAIQGGIVYIEGDYTKVDNATCGNSSATKYGGAFYIDGIKTTISNSSVENTNASLSGGAIYIHGVDATVDNSNFEKTNAFGSTGNGGGAIFIDGDRAVVKRSNFTSTEAANNTHAIGGAIYITGDDVNVTGSNFNNTAANLYGGAIYIYGENTIIRDSNFTNCSIDTDGSQGGAIYVNGINAKIIGSDFKECSAVLYGGSIYVHGLNTLISDSNFTESSVTAEMDRVNNIYPKGGAIYIDGKNTNIVRSDFEECSAAYQGGGIYIDGESTNVLYSNFTGCDVIAPFDKDNNIVPGGGAIYIQGSKATINASSFINNTATGAGGGIYSNGAGSKVYNCNFTGNNASDNEVNDHGGGAIFWKGSTKSDTMENCTFTSNNAAFGGAIRWAGTSSVASGLIKNCTFLYNTGHKGSTISWASSNEGHVTLCTFIGNAATKNGGIYAGTNNNGGGNGFKISNSTFINNTARCGADIATSITNAIITDCNFTNSISGYGGSIVIRERVPKNTKIMNCIFINTSSIGSNDGNRNGGGAIYVAEDVADNKANNIEIINVKIINSTSNTDGGAIKWGANADGKGAYGKLINVTIINATATSTWNKKYNDYGRGGAIYWLGQYGTFINVTVINANSRNNGGAVYFEGLSGNITNSTFINCVANKTGGAIYWNGANGLVFNSTFDNNSAISGGGIYWAGTTGKVLNSTFKNNKATNGGAVYWIGTDGLLANSTFIKNHADKGGAIYWKESSSKFTNNKVYNNTANYGGAAYWDADGGSIDDSIMMYNKAVNGSAIYVINPLTITNTVLLENQAHAYEIYNRATTVIERVDDLITVFTYLRGGDNVLNAIYNDGVATILTFRNVTYLGVGGRRNTGDENVQPVIPETGYPENDGRIYQTNLEVYQDIYVRAYDEDNILQMNESGKTNYNGSIFYSANIANAGGVNVKVYHPEDNYYTYIAFANNTKLPIVIIEVEDIYFQQTEYVNITVKPAEDGETARICERNANVTVSINGQLYLANVSLIENPDGISGSVTIPIKDLHVGTYSVYVEYSGNNRYIPEYNYTSFNVLKIPSWITVHVDNYTYGETGKAIIETIKNTTANVTAIINGKEYHLVVNETGHVELFIPLLDADNYTAEVYYLESNDCYASSADCNFTIFKTNSTINITGEFLDTQDTVKLYINVGPADTCGKISILFNDKQYNITLTNSTAELTIYNVPHKVYQVYAEYYGDRNHYGSNNTTEIDASKYASYINIDVTNITYGDNETIVFTLPEGAKGNLTITFNGETFNRTIVNGQVILENIRLAAGTYPVNATYLGDKNYAGSYNETFFIVSKAIPVLEPVLENITYMDIEHIVANINQTGNVSIIIRSLIDPEIIIAQNLTINITNKHNVTWNVSGLARGEYIAQFIFYGNQNYTGCEVNETFIVDYATPIIIVEVNNTKVDCDVPINITVYPRANVTGNVSVYVDGIKIGEYDLTEGFVRITGRVSNLINGTHDVVAVYNGDANFTHAHNSTTFNVSKYDPKFNVTALNVTAVQNGQITVHLPANATGIVLIKVNDTPYYVNLSSTRILTLPLLGNGTYTVWANYTGDGYWNSAVNTTKFNVTSVKVTCYPINVTAVDVEIGVNTTITVRVPIDATGNVTIWVNGTSIVNTTIVEGVATFHLNKTIAGRYEVNATLSDDKYANKTAYASYWVSKLEIPIEISVNPIYVGQTAIITVTAPKDISNNISIEINGKQYNKSVDANGHAVFEVPISSEGIRTVVATYDGDDKYMFNSTTRNFTASKNNTAVDINVSDIVYGGKVNITVNVTADAKGFITISINNTINNTLPISQGKVNWIVEGLDVENYTVYAYYSGDEKFNANNNNRAFEVTKATPVITIDPVEVSSARNATVVVHITPGATGRINITVNGENYSGEIENGIARITIKQLDAGSYPIFANYTGDDNFVNNSVTQNRLTVFKYSCYNMTVTANDTYVGSNTTIIVNVPLDARGNVSITVNGLWAGNATISQGVAKLNVTKDIAGKYVVNATFTDGKYANKTVTTNYHVVKYESPLRIDVASIYVGQIAYINVTAPSNNVTIEINGKSYDPVSYSDGVARFRVSDLAYGNKTVTAVYGGSYKYLVNSTTRNFTVNKYDSTIKVNVSDINVGGVAIINLTAPATANGYAIVNINGTNYTVNITNGVGQLPVTGLGNGTYRLNVTYIGDGKFFPSVNNTKTFNVNKVQSQINMTVTNNGIIPNGTNVNITIEAPTDATGKVNITVWDGNKNTTYIIYVNDGKGILHIDVPQIGIYNVTARYMGDDKYLPSANKTQFEVYDTGKELGIATGADVPVNANETVTVLVSGNHVNKEVTIILRNASGVILTRNVTLNSYIPLFNATSAQLILPQLDAGHYDVDAFYLEIDGAKRILHQGHDDFNVYKLSSKLDVNIKNITVGENVTIELDVTPGATGNISVFVNCVEYKANTSNPVVVIPNLNASVYNVHAFYYGDDMYNGSDNVTSFRVDKNLAPISINVTKQGSTAQVNVTLPVNATGQVLLDIGDKHYYANVTGGLAQFDITDLKEGKYNITAVYVGDYKYLSNYTNSTIEIEKVKTTPDIVVVDQGNGTVVVVVGDNASGNVTVTVNGKDYPANVTNGTAIVTLDDIEPGKQNITVVYSGDDNHEETTLNATAVGPKYDSELKVDINDIKEGEDAVITVYVPENATGNVTVIIDGVEHTTDNITGGVATIRVTDLTAGNKTVVVVYSGDDNYINNYTIGKFVVENVKATPEIVVVDQGNGTVVVVVGDNASGNVTVTVNGKDYPANVTNGTAVVTLDDIEPGKQNITVVYSGDDNHNETTVNATAVGPKYDSDLKVDIKDIKAGEDAVITVYVPENATGNVTVIIDGVEHTTDNITGGVATIRVTDLTAGNKTVVVVYSGDDNYINNYTIDKFVVENVKVTPDIVVVDQGNGTVVVVVGDNATGNVTVKVGNETYNGTVVNGKAVITLDNVTSGSHNITVTYSGDGQHTNATANATVDIQSQSTPMEIITENIGVGDKEIIKVKVPGDAKGNVTIEIDGVKYSRQIINGIATFEVEGLTAGDKSVFATFDGDDKYVSNYTSGQFKVSKIASNITVEITDIDVGENVTVTVHVPGDATGQVLIDIDGVGYYVNVTGGIGKVQIPRIPNGVYNVVLTYVGNDKYLSSYNESSLRVSKVGSFVIPIAHDIYVGENEVIKLYVPAGATGTVTVVINGEEYNFNLDTGVLSASYSEGTKYIVAVSGGNGELVISGLPKGEYIVSVRYNGDEKYMPAVNTTTFIVSKEKTQMEVIDNGNGTVVVVLPENATGNVTVKIENQTYTAEVSNGKAVINLENATPGKHDIEVRYTGDNDYASSTTKSSVDIPKYYTPISVESHDISVGETEVVIVTLPEDAKGSVTIEINGKEYTTDVVDGKAVFEVTGLAFGEKTVAVKYSGDDRYCDNYTTDQFTVSKVPSTIKASGKDVKSGKDEVITVNVPSDATGQILVEINGEGYYGTIINGKAKIIVPRLPAGTYKATVTYEGDDKYLPSTTAISFKVSATSTPISAKGDDIDVGSDASVVIHLPSDATGYVTITIDGKKYTAQVINGVAKFNIPGLPKGNFPVEVYYSGDSKYDANKTTTIVSVNGDGDNNNGDHGLSGDGGISLAKYETGNPIFVLLLIILAIGSSQIRRFKK